MNYIFKQKLQISDLTGLDRPKRKILIHEPEAYLSALYGYYLQGQDFEVRHCPLEEAVADYAKIFIPDILVFNIEPGQGQQAKANRLAALKKQLPNLLVVTTGFNLSGEFLKKIMPVGISGHINRRLSRPQDLETVIRSILN